MNLTILSALKIGEDSLKKAKFENYKRETKELLEDVTGLTPEEIFLLNNKKIGLSKTKKFLKKIQRRINGEPIQYITKKGYFFSRTFSISKGVLVPRPETEILVEKILKTKWGKNKITCLDMCAGSGCIGITLALEDKRFKEITLADRSTKALKCCEVNILNFKVSKKTEIIKTNFFSNIHGKKFDLICSNPPYVSSNEYKYLDESIKNYEPKLALISKDNGLGHLKHIAKEGRKYLKKNGTIFFEIGINQLKEVENILNCFGYSELLSYNDLNKVKRIVSAKWKN